MNVELISVGTEILLGNIVNTNAAFLSEQCAKLGLSCFYQSVVGDNEERLEATLKTAISRSDIVVLSGGLGPTQDDLTKEVTAKVMKRELYLDNHSKERIGDYFKNRGITITENNWKQAMIPTGALIIDNDNGTAPGIIMEEGEKRIILLPGPPNELEQMFDSNIVPYLKKILPGTIYSKTVKICGVGESTAETMIKDLIEKQTNPTIAPYAKTGEVHLRVTAKADDEREAKKMTKPIIKELKERFGNNVYTTEEDVTLEKAVVDLLIANNLTVSTVESCTGGMLAARLINVPGVSNVFKAGFITYSNKSKRKLVGVKKATIDRYGAVSKKVAEEMVKGAYLENKADVIVSITGLAGPDGGTALKPVGLVYAACYVCGKVTVREFHFSGNRAKIRETAVANTLTLMRHCILEYYSEVTFGMQK